MGIFNKASISENAAEDVSGDTPTIKYPKPKVLLLDLPSAVSDTLIEKGYNIHVGSLGKPYKVEKSSNYQPLIGKSTLPNYTEQEIVVVDLLYEKPASGPVGERERPESEKDIWAKCDSGIIDPRPRAAMQVQQTFDRIHSAGGVFVVFADEKLFIKMQIAYVQHRNFVTEQEFDFDVWHIISELADMRVSTDHGMEMRPCADSDSALSRLVGEFLNGGEFFCTLKGGYRSRNPWVSIVENKFGDSVGVARCLGVHGSVIVLPQIENKSEFLVKLFTNILPEIAPHLFPNIEQGKWTHLPEYELAHVLELKARQVDVEQQAIVQLAKLEAEIEAEQDRSGWIHDLLTGTGDKLVEAVKGALAELGFQNVVDVDKERDKEGKSRREDLQIHDQNPLLIVDIKGIGGYPSDDDALQAGKHAMIRMREMGRTDINGLSIINHQRHLPPLDRENSMPFRQELIHAAMEQALGLMTSWDMYRLVRNVRKLGWSSDDVRSIFYVAGRVEVVPSHYQYIGRITKAWTDKLGVTLEQGELKLGDRIAVEFQIEFEEAPVESILVNGKSVQQANVNDQTGVLWPAGMPKLREGLRVFRISAKS